MKEINSNDWIELRDYVASRFINDSETFSEVLFRGHIVIIENDTHEESFRLWIDLPINDINEKNTTKMFRMNSPSYGKSLWYVIEYIHENVKNRSTKNENVTTSFSNSDQINSDVLSSVFSELVTKAKILTQLRPNLKDIEPSIIFYSANNIVAEFSESEMYSNTEHHIVDLTPFLNKSVEYVRQYMKMKTI
jgi:hypothetical protein